MTSQERGMIPHEAKGLVNTAALHCTAAREEAALERGGVFCLFCFFSFSFWLILFKERGDDGRMFCIVGWSHCVVWIDSIWWSCATAWGYISDWWVSLIAIFYGCISIILMFMYFFTPKKLTICSISWFLGYTLQQRGMCTFTLPLHNMPSRLQT